MTKNHNDDETSTDKGREIAPAIAETPTMTQTTEPNPLSAEKDPGCPSCRGGVTESTTENPKIYIYALGRIEARFPSPAVEKEFAQAVGRSETIGQTDKEALHTALSQRENRYLARRLCWVLKVQGIETYILTPRDSADIDLLIEAIRPVPSPLDVDVVIGRRGPIAPPEMCNGLMVPIVLFEQIYSFDSPTLIESIPRPEKAQAQKFEAVAQELLGSLMENVDNAGATDADRAKNYLFMRYPAIYAKCAECHDRNLALTEMATHPSRLSGVRNIVDVVFSFTHRQTDVTEKYFVRVDVTEEFPFLVSKISPYFSR